MQGEGLVTLKLQLSWLHAPSVELLYELIMWHVYSKINVARIQAQINETSNLIGLCESKIGDSAQPRKRSIPYSFRKTQGGRILHITNTCLDISAMILAY